MSSPSSWICERPITPATIASAVTGERQDPYGLVCPRGAIPTRLPFRLSGCGLRVWGCCATDALFRGFPRRRDHRPRWRSGQPGGHHRICAAVRPAADAPRSQCGELHDLRRADRQRLAHGRPLHELAGAQSNRADQQPWLSGNGGAELAGSRTARRYPDGPNRGARHPALEQPADGDRSLARADAQPARSAGDDRDRHQLLRVEAWLAADPREEHIRRAVAAHRFSLHESGRKTVGQSDQAHVVADEGAEPSAGHGAQIKGAGRATLGPVHAAIARRAEPDVGIEGRAATREMAEVVPQQADGGVAGNRERREKGLGSLANHELWRAPVESGILRAGDKYGGEVAVVLEPADIHGISRRCRADVLAGKAKLPTGARIDGVREREPRSIYWCRPGLALVGGAD